MQPGTLRLLHPCSHRPTPALSQGGCFCLDALAPESTVACHGLEERLWTADGHGAKASSRALQPVVKRRFQIVDSENRPLAGLPVHHPAQRVGGLGRPSKLFGGPMRIAHQRVRCIVNGRPPQRFGIVRDGHCRWHSPPGKAENARIEQQRTFAICWWCDCRAMKS